MLSLAASPMLTAHSARFKPHRLPPFRWPGHQVTPCTLFGAFPSPLHSNLPLLVLKQLEANIPNNMGPFHVSKCHQAWWWLSTVFPQNYARVPRDYTGPLVGSKGNAPCGGLGAKQTQSWLFKTCTEQFLCICQMLFPFFFSHVHGSACNLWTCTSI